MQFVDIFENNNCGILKLSTIHLKSSKVLQTFLDSLSWNITKIKSMNLFRFKLCQKLWFKILTVQCIRPAFPLRILNTNVVNFFSFYIRKRFIKCNPIK